MFMCVLGDGCKCSGVLDENAVPKLELQVVVSLMGVLGTEQGSV